MHIPDGYLSPQTDAILGLTSAIAAAGAAYKTAHTLRAKYIPMLSIGAAFSFTIMMFNVPIPDGTTAHAVGGSLLAVLLGPWAAMISVSIALIIQALFFGDGGILALGANIMNMAVVLPFVSYGIYRLIAGRSSLGSKRQWIGAALAGYIGLSAAALCAGIEFGLQPILFHAANGTPLYSPYSLNIAVPAMLFAHLTVAGPVEGLVSALVLTYLQRTNPGMLQLKSSPEKSAGGFHYRKLIIGLIILAVLSPLGLLASGTAWGEWGGEELQDKVGFIPGGLQKFGDFWRHTLLKDYGVSGYDHTFWQQALGYLLSAFFGLLVIGLITLIIQRLLRRSQERIS
ncbi:ABC-type Co2+ transport system, permease component [Desulfosporosinus acidiphilus SJ4]|uniref:ABC-type Co2+ transport system, permease component n=1 Tax=Desulfosporosinus acidiphilus (strain DSM 22704 / JCM 16185 / SJ4) TaxID=646529 RepID=I4D0G0_DESAJ|nr:cobalt transporter CbiM [Desulfosporosinus acidiphilus]AFM39284.1 ABC-type Co2+ transport system, permease component [Desulfosporosinus acidiphilus SJ4]